RAGLVIDDKVFDAAKLTGKPAYATVLAILEDWRAAQPVLQKAAPGAGQSRLQGPPGPPPQLFAPGGRAPAPPCPRAQSPRPTAPAPITPTMPRKWPAA